jgi:membrane protease YdiL (CAAX protease family)
LRKQFSMKKLQSRSYLLVPAAFLVYLLIRNAWFSIVYQFLLAHIHESVTAYFVASCAIGLPIFIATWLLHKKKFADSLGLSGNFLKGFFPALLFTAPMFVGYSLIYEFNATLTYTQVAVGAFFAGFFEELYFRAFFFGLLFRYTRLGFIPALLISALIFASLHLYQSEEPAAMAGIFIATLMGAGFFAWLYTEWKFNIWLIVNMHVLMNLSWMLFDAGDNALGPVLSNIFRAVTIASAILTTLWIKKRQQQKLEVNRNTIWLKAVDNG